MEQLSASEMERYSRHLLLPEVGEAGQDRLKRSSVLVVGAGGLGSPCSLYLAAAGVGRLGIADPDRVDLSNLQRQIVHSTDAVGTLKTDSAHQRLHGLNPDIEIETHPVRLTSTNARSLVRRYDVIVDGSDNFPTRYLLNDACVLEGRPLVYGAIHRFEGQVSLFCVNGHPCYRCLYSEPPPPHLVPSCAEGGVLGVLPGIIGSLQALEAIKYILETGRSLASRLVLFDGLTLSFRELAIHRDPGCPVCGDHPTVTSLIDYEQFCGVADAGSDGREITVDELDAALRSERPPFIIDVRQPHEWVSAPFSASVQIPLPELGDRLSDVPSDQDIVTVCRSGRRSLRAVEVLRASGRAGARSLRGGVMEWRARHAG